MNSMCAGCVACCMLQAACCHVNKSSRSMRRGEGISEFMHMKLRGRVGRRGRKGGLMWEGAGEIDKD